MFVCDGSVCVGWMKDSTLPQIINSILHAQLQLDEEQIGISYEHQVKIFDVVRCRFFSLNFENTIDANRWAEDGSEICRSWKNINSENSFSHLKLKLWIKSPFLILRMPYHYDYFVLRGSKQRNIACRSNENITLSAQLILPLTLRYFPTRCLPKAANT